MCIFDTRPFAWKLENWLKAQELLWLNGNESQPKWGKTSGKKHKRIECLWLHCSVCTNPLDNFAFACVFTLNIRYRMRIMHIHALLLPLLISMAQVLWLCYEKLGTDGTLFHIPDETAYVFVLKKFNHWIQKLQFTKHLIKCHLIYVKKIPSIDNDIQTFRSLKIKISNEAYNSIKFRIWST